jgi:hypothetical protein
MTVFQWITLPVLAALAVLDGYRVLFAHPSFRRDRVIRFVVWLLAAAAVYNPDITTAIANRVGIGTGTNLVLYAFVLAFLVVSFQFYSRSVRFERQLTDVVRHIAVREAERAAATDPPKPGAP